MMSVPFVDLTAQYKSIKSEINRAVARVLAKGQYILGTEVQALEAEVAQYCETEYAVGVASGTDALHLALLACGIRTGDEVITTPFTFVATVEAIKHCGATPVFVDIDKRTFNIDSSQIESKISRKTRAILPVHLYGQPADMDEIADIAQKHKLKVIEDCAQALGAEYKDKKVGSFGDAGCLSFFPSKSLGACGDGGMVVTSDSEIAQKVQMLITHGADEPYHYSLIGFNSRLDEMQAAVLRVKLKRLDKWITLRNRNATLYNQLIDKIYGIDPPHVKEYNKASYNYYTVCVRSAKLTRNEIRNHLNKKGIQTMIYYPLSLYLQRAYRYLGYKKGDFPNSEWAQDKVLSLPMYPEMGEGQIRRVSGEISAVLRSI